MSAPSSTPDGLKLWQRFHIRLSLMYGGLVLAVLLSIAGVFYVRGVSAEVQALQARLRIAAMSLATAITAEDLAVLQVEADAARPEYLRIASRFRAVAVAEPEFSDIYIMRHGAAPGSLELVVDVVMLGDAPPGKVGEAYEPAHSTKMQEGFERPTVEDAPYTDAWGTVLSGYAPIRDGAGKAIALVGVDVRASRLAALKRDVAFLVLGVLAVSILVLAILSVIVGRSIRKPLARIVEATNAIASGRLHVRAELQRADEFGVVGRHFDDMASGLQERDFIKTTFGQYVAPEVVQRMITDRSQALFGQRRHAAVMFVDLRRFTTLSEGMAPEEVVTMLNDYLDRMTSVITRHGGRIDKFIGDAIMADWGTLDDSPRPEADAVTAALGMLREIAAWNVDRVAAGNAALEIGIAIHAGPVVAGSIGSARKLEYTVIGDAVNVASRLEGLCKVFGARLVVSGTLVEAAGLTGGTRWLDTLVLRGRTEATDVYEILDEADPRRARVDDYAAAVALLRSGDRVAAKAAFEALRDLGPDPVVDHQLERVATETAAASITD
ncbi:MAG: HAMP domain-containing protein [Myxococcales bacterium]|nr:HAMP domain-containing protein [Myxococcales bacterium]